MPKKIVNFILYERYTYDRLVCTNVHTVDLSVNMRQAMLSKTMQTFHIQFISWIHNFMENACMPRKLVNNLLRITMINNIIFWWYVLISTLIEMPHSVFFTADASQNFIVSLIFMIWSLSWSICLENRTIFLDKISFLEKFSFMIWMVQCHCRKICNWFLTAYKDQWLLLFLRFAVQLRFKSIKELTIFRMNHMNFSFVFILPQLNKQSQRHVKWFRLDKCKFYAFNCGNLSKSIRKWNAIKRFMMATE